MRQRTKIAVSGVLIALSLAIPLFCDSRPKPSTLWVVNRTAHDSTVYVSFGASSHIVADDWKSFCKVTSRLNCQFGLVAGKTRGLPMRSQHLDATISFDGEGCGATKAELNVNNPAWYDQLDVSLVDGYSNNILIQVRVESTDGGTIDLGPPKGKDGNEKVFGLFPYGCDICTARQNPPCGIAKGTTGCKSGTQYKPDVPCQYQGTLKGGGGSHILIVLEP
jgi:hypothetical protein